MLLACLWSSTGCPGNHCRNILELFFDWPTRAALSAVISYFGKRGCSCPQTGQDLIGITLVCTEQAETSILRVTAECSSRCSRNRSQPRGEISFHWLLLTCVEKNGQRNADCGLRHTLKNYTFGLTKIQLWLGLWSVCACPLAFTSKS